MLGNREYKVLLLPLDYNKNFLDLTSKEIKEYYNWFSKIKDKRLSYLCEFLFKKSQECLYEEKLNVIEVFLLNSISTKPKPKEQFNTELMRIPAHFKPYAKPDDYLFVERTISICYDVGIFLGELIISLDSKIKWGLEKNDKYVDYGQPVLKKAGCKFDVNPFSVVKNMAAKIYEGRYSDGQIITAFDTWKKGFKVET